MADPLRDAPPPSAAPGGGATSLILGSLSLVLWCCPPVGVGVALLGLILGARALGGSGRGAALAGMALSAAGAIASVATGALVGTIMVKEEELKALPAANKPPFVK